ncbi:MAG: fasciclin domain-containing protein [Chitinophagaceae bacterium]
MSTILQLMNADRNLSSFMKGMKMTDLEEALSGMGPFTIIGPVNLAFGSLAPTSYEELLRTGNSSKIADILSYHVLAEKKLNRDFYNGQKIKTIHGKELEVIVKDGEVRIQGARILSKDRQASNGVVHTIDTVINPVQEKLLPKEAAAVPQP